MRSSSWHAACNGLWIAAVLGVTKMDIPYENC